MKQKKPNKPGCKIFVLLISLLIFSFAVCCPTDSQAQDATAQLEYRLEHLVDDTARVNVLLKLGEQYCSINNDKALMYLQEAFTISTSLNYTEGIGKSLLWQGRVYYYKDDYPLSNKYFDKAEKALATTNDQESLAFLYFAKAVNCKIRGDYIHAVELYQQAIQVAEETGNTILMATCYAGIGRVLLDRNEPEKAMSYFREALIFKKLSNDLKGEANILSAIAITFDQTGATDSSLAYHYRALKIKEEFGMDRSVASSEYQIAGVLIKKGCYRDAEKALNSAMDIFSQMDEKTGIIISKLRLAAAKNKQGKPGSVDLALEGLAMARKIDNPNLISHSYKVLSDIYAFNDDYKESYNYLLKYKTIQDSLFSSEKERILIELEAKYQAEKKDNEIKLLKSETEVQRKNNLLLIVLIVVFAGVIVMLTYFFRLKSTAFKRQQMLLEQEKIIHRQEHQIDEKEKQLLQEQLESKNRELASKALEMIRYNDAISSIIEKLEDLNSTLKESPETVKPIKDIIRELENHNKQNIWSEFEKIFKNIHSDFYDKLLTICPDLSASEIKTAALLKLNLTTKEIAAITFKSEGGIKTTRYRLRKKLNLSSDDKLVPFLMQI